jgi:hypothetical protein
MYQIFKLVDAKKSFLRTPYLIAKVHKDVWNEYKNEYEIEVIELNANGTFSSLFFNEYEFLYEMALGHQFFGEAEDLSNAISLCDKEINYENIPITRVRKRQN